MSIFNEMNRRFIPIIAIRDGDNFRPFWEFNYYKSDLYGDLYGDTYKDKITGEDFRTFYELIWDNKKSCIRGMAIVDCKSDFNFNTKVGDLVVVEDYPVLTIKEVTRVEVIKKELIFQKVKDLDKVIIQKYSISPDAKIIAFQHYEESIYVDGDLEPTSSYKIKKLNAGNYNITKIK